jgi:hypothetical protein
MNIRNTGHKSKADKIRNKEIIDEAHKEIDDFRETKKSVTDLIRKKRGSAVDTKAVQEAEHRAIDAINHLFDEEADKTGK